MAGVKWKITGPKTYRTGVIDAESDREAMEKLLAGEHGLGDPDPDTSYSFTVGELSGSAFGDEFVRVARASKIDESNVDMSSGYLHDDPVRKKLEEKAREASVKDFDDYVEAMAGRAGKGLESDDLGAVTPTPVKPKRKLDFKLNLPPLPEEMMKALDEAKERMDKLAAEKAWMGGTPIYPATGDIMQDVIRRVQKADMQRREELARHHIIHMALAKAQGGWSPYQAQRVVRDEARRLVKVEFGDAERMEVIILTDMEIQQARF